MDLKGLKVKTITYPYGEYHLGTPAEIIDEGSFYRIDGTHIFDKHKVKEIIEDDGRIRVKMIDKVVTLEVVQCLSICMKRLMSALNGLKSRRKEMFG